MTEIQGKSILVRVSARFELARVRVIRESSVHNTMEKFVEICMYNEESLCETEESN